jgi:hypothetical protein
MDIFTLDTSGQMGKVINGLDEVVWTERYVKAGDFKATTTDLSLSLDLPKGAYISHDETLEIVKILDHQIIKERGSTAKLIITGETLEKPLLESRISVPSLTGYKNHYDNSSNSYIYSPHPSWVHAQYLIEGHLTGNLNIWGVLGLVQKMPGIVCVQEVVGTETPLLQREIERGQVYDQVMKLLAIGSCGLKIRRPIENRQNIEIVIYKGKDKSSEVSVSADMDQIDSASYLFSIRTKKNIVYVSGQWGYIQFLAPGYTTPNPMTDNWLHVDASDIEIPEPSIGETDVAAYNKLLHARGLEALAQYKEIEMADVTPYKLFSQDYYRKYGMGDIIGVSGDYGGRTHLRVEEFTWTKDKNGVEHYPTFGVVDPSELTPHTG